MSPLRIAKSDFASNLLTGLGRASYRLSSCSTSSQSRPLAYFNYCPLGWHRNSSKQCCWSKRSLGGNWLRSIAFYICMVNVYRVIYLCLLAAQDVKDTVRWKLDGHHGFSCMQNVCVEANCLRSSTKISPLRSTWCHWSLQVVQWYGGSLLVFFGSATEKFLQWNE